MAIKRIEVRIAETREKIAGVQLSIEEQRKLRWQLVGDIVSDLRGLYQDVMSNAKGKGDGTVTNEVAEDIADGIIDFFGLDSATIKPETPSQTDRRESYEKKHGRPWDDDFLTPRQKKLRKGLIHPP